MTKHKQVTKYMHTLDGKPAQFYPESELVCFNHRRVKLVDTLKQIRREQDISMANSDAHEILHGYVTVRV